MSRLASIAFVVLFIVQDPAPSTGDVLPQQAKFALAPYRTATVRSGDAVWTFSTKPGPKEHGLHVQVGDPNGAKEFDLLLDGQIGRVVGVVAVARESYSDRGSMITLGIVSLSEGGRTFEYRFAFQRDSSRLDRDWAHSPPLITKPLEDPFNVMSVTMPGGDSIVMTLQKISRTGKNENLVETHTFINHCPVSPSELIGKLTKHHVSTTKDTQIDPQS